MRDLAWRVAGEPRAPAESNAGVLHKARACRQSQMPVATVRFIVSRSRPEEGKLPGIWQNYPRLPVENSSSQWYLCPIECSPASSYAAGG